MAAKTFWPNDHISHFLSQHNTIFTIQQGQVTYTHLISLIRREMSNNIQGSKVRREKRKRYFLSVILVDDIIRGDNNV